MTEGQIYGKLTAMFKLPITKLGNYWQFQCSCGNITKTRASMVKYGQTRSCGCLRKESYKRKW